MRGLSSRSFDVVPSGNTDASSPESGRAAVAAGVESEDTIGVGGRAAAGGGARGVVSQC